jgi:hypothetical protein
MKINGKELKDIIKDGVMDITGDLKSLVVKKKSSSVVIQNGNVVSGNMSGGTFVQNINGGVNAKGVQFGCIGPGSSQQRIFIDGKEVDADIAQGIQVINVSGNVGKLDSAGAVNVGGDVNGKVDSNGSVDIKGNVKGNIDSNGRVQCGDVTGNIDSNGRVECGTVGGDIDAMGSVSMRK